MDNMRWKEKGNQEQVLEEIHTILSSAKKLKSSDKYLVVAVAAKWEGDENLYLPDTTNKRIAMANKRLKLKELKAKDIEELLLGKNNDEYIDIRFKDIVLHFKNFNNLAAYRIVPLPVDVLWTINIDGDDVDDYEEVKIYKVDKNNRVLGFK